MCKRPLCKCCNLSKLLCIKTSLCKRFCVYELLCVKASVGEKAAPLSCRLTRANMWSPTWSKRQFASPHMSEGRPWDLQQQFWRLESPFCLVGMKWPAAPWQVERAQENFAKAYTQQCTKEFSRASLVVEHA